MIKEKYNSSKNNNVKVGEIGKKEHGIESLALFLTDVYDHHQKSKEKKESAEEQERS